MSQVGHRIERMFEQVVSEHIAGEQVAKATELVKQAVGGLDPRQAGTNLREVAPPSFLISSCPPAVVALFRKEP